MLGKVGGVCLTLCGCWCWCLPRRRGWSRIVGYYLRSQCLQRLSPSFDEYVNLLRFLDRGERDEYDFGPANLSEHV